MVNAASPRMSHATAPLQGLVLVHPVEVQKELFTQGSFKAVIAAIDLQQTMLSPGRRKMERIARYGLNQDSPATTEYLPHTNHIYGPDAFGLKGKGTKRKIPYISVDTIKVLPSIKSLYRNVTACGDVFFVNKVTLFGAINLNILYGYEGGF